MLRTLMHDIASWQRRSRARQDIERLPPHLRDDIGLPPVDSNAPGDPFFNEVMGRS